MNTMVSRFCGLPVTPKRSTQNSTVYYTLYDYFCCAHSNKNSTLNCNNPLNRSTLNWDTIVLSNLKVHDCTFDFDVKGNMFCSLWVWVKAISWNDTSSGLCSRMLSSKALPIDWWLSSEAKLSDLICVTIDEKQLSALLQIYIKKE